MLVSDRPASVPIQMVALLIGIVDGLVAFFAFVGLLMVILPPGAGLLLVWLCIAACAYSFVAPATWRGLWRRALATFGASLLLFAVLGYLFEFAGLAAGGMPDLPAFGQLLIVVLGLGGLLGARALRDQRLPAAQAPPSEEPASEPSAKES